MKRSGLTAQGAYRLYRSKGKPVLKQSVVGFFDVLGLRSQIATATFPAAQQALLRSVHTALHASLSHLKARNVVSVPGLWAIKSFTDNIVLGWPYLDDAEAELGGVFYRAAYFQLALINAGLFCRGAI